MRGLRGACRRRHAAGRAGFRARALPGTGQRKPVQGAAPSVLRRARRGQAAARLGGERGHRHGGSGRRGHDGRRHCDEPGQRRTGRGAGGTRRASARARMVGDPQELRGDGRQGKTVRGAGGRTPGADPHQPRHGKFARCRSGDRGGVRGHGRQAPDIHSAGRSLQARGHPGFEHLASGYRRDRRVHPPVLPSAGDALFQPGECHAPAGSRERPRDGRKCRRRRVPAGSHDGQAARAGRRLRRLCRQPHGQPLHARGPLPAGGRSIAVSGGWRLAALRTGNGAPAHGGHGGPGHQLGIPQAHGADPARPPALFARGRQLV
ncbi:hypothetical protein D3C87_1298840 [compost metagenome]